MNCGFLDFVPIFLLGVGLAMDAFSVCVGYGVCFKNANVSSAFRLAGTTAAFQMAMPLMGWFTGAVLGKFISAWAPLIAFILLLLVAIKMLIEAFKAKEDCEVYDVSRGRHLFMIAIATSIDAFAAGITIGLLKMSVFLSVAIIGAVTFILSFSGVYIGKKAGKFLGKWAEISGGVILLVIAIKFLFDWRVM